MIKEAIVKIVNKEDLTYDEAYTVMNEIMSGERRHRMRRSFPPFLQRAQGQRPPTRYRGARRRCAPMR